MGEKAKITWRIRKIDFVLKESRCYARKEPDKEVWRMIIQEMTELKKRLKKQHRELSNP